MPNKTIYVSEQDAPLFDDAKEIAGTALSSVIVQALKEYIARQKKKAKGMQEIKIHVGGEASEREQRFVGMNVGDWKGFSDDKEWWLGATIYRTQKGNWAVHLVTICKASLLTNKKAWKESGDYLINPRHAELFVAKDAEELKPKLPKALFAVVKDLVEKDEKPIEYLDI
jgi:EXLDI family protein